MGYSRQQTVLEEDFRKQDQIDAEEDETRWKPKMAVNDDNSDSYDSDDDEALRAAKRAIYHRQRTDKS